MRSSPKWTSLAWLLVPLASVAWCVLLNQSRLDRLAELEAQVPLSALPASPDPLALPVPAVGTQLTLGAHPESQEWILQTTLAQKTGTWRLREVDYDNAPRGRITHRAAPYRWWLQGTATLLGSPEAAARWADPLLQIVTLLAGAGLVAWRWGRWAGAMTAVLLALLYPWAGDFAAANPSELSLVLAWSAAGGLLLLLGLQASTTRPTTWFAASGAAAGIAVWISPGLGVPWVLATAVGAALAGGLGRPGQSGAWRIWGFAGALAVLLGWVIEYVPAAINWQELRAVHPLYALAWCGLGDLLHRLWHRRWGKVAWIPAAIAVLALPLALFGWDQSGFLAATSLMSQLTRQSGALEANNLAHAWSLPGGPARVLASLLHLFVLVPAALRLRRERGACPSLWIAVGLTLVLIAWACVRVQWWAWVNVGAFMVWLALLDPTRLDAKVRRTWTIGTAIVLLPGLMGLLPTSADATGNRALAERDLARFLARRSGSEPTVVLAPPQTTMALIYHGGLRGLGTPFWENLDGFRVSSRLAGTNSQDEALALVEQRQLTTIVMPSWDPFLDEYARLGATDLDASLVALLQNWLPPRWLRPVPYELPAAAGMEGEAVMVFEVVDVQDDPTALSRLAEYFIAMGDLRRAVAVAQALQNSFSTDPGGLVAQAQVAVAINKPALYRQTMERLLPLLQEGRDRVLLWDQRVSLTLMLAQGGLEELLTEQLQRTVRNVDERDLRHLSAAKLREWLQLLDQQGLALPDAGLAALAPVLARPY